MSYLPFSGGPWVEGEDEHVWIVFSRERVRTVRRAVARFPSVVVGEVVEAIITAQTNDVDAFVILESTGKGVVAIETCAGKRDGKFCGDLVVRI